MQRDVEYENKNTGYDDQYPEEKGGGIKCWNYKVCGGVLPKWWFDCKGSYLCTNCDMNFSKLKFIDKSECPVCLEEKECVKQLKCEHTTCIDCFVRCQFGEQIEQPQFPYSEEINDEWEYDPYNEKWNREYPLIRVWNEELDRLENMETQNFKNTEYLRKCPLCRK
jgi:hypothetical protein